MERCERYSLNCTLRTWHTKRGLVGVVSDSRHAAGRSYRYSCRQAPYGRTPRSRSARHARRAPPCDSIDRTHYLQLLKAHMGAVGLTLSRAVIAEDIRDLQRRSSHG